jgi:hypothetical protein
VVSEQAPPRDTGERDPLGNVIVEGCPFPAWCRFTPGPTHRHSIIRPTPAEALQRLHDRAHDIAGEAFLNWRALLQEACAEARRSLPR